ncbi:MAG TPA: non-heme iron oxygenase ferredoxin subunit [Pyrinomonadaceae bacterium]
MQSFNTSHDDLSKTTGKAQIITAGRADDIPPGRSVTVELPDGSELALYNVDGEFHATTNYCPHKGARLSDGVLCGHTIECGLHGWQFDVRDGNCLTVPERLETFQVTIEDGWLRIEVKAQAENSSGGF